MFFLFLFAALSLENVPFADLEEYGLFSCANLRAHKFGANYILCSTIEDAVFVLDAEGNLKAKYQKSGLGPEELSAPFIVGVQDDRILVASKNSQTIAFNKNLRPLPKKPPSLPYLMTGGASLDNNVSLMQTQFQSNHWFTEFTLSDGGWLAGRAFFPVAFDMEDRTFFRYYKHQNSEIIAYPGLIREDHYEISVYLLGDDQPKLSFGALVDEWLKPTRDVWTTNVVKAGGAYLVSLSVDNKKSRMTEALYVDVFDQNGRFLMREPTPEKLKLVSVAGSPEVLVVNCERMHIVRILDGVENPRELGFGQ